MMRSFLIFLFLAGSVCLVHAQDLPYLERPVNLDVNDRPIAEVLKSISEQTSVVFSYTRFDDTRKITVNCYRKPLRTVLSEILSASNCTYKVKDKYVIIKCSNSSTPPSNIVLSGYVYNASDSSKIDRASIYIEETKNSSLTNEYGYFIISCPETAPKVLLSIAKESYYDTTIILYKPTEASMVVYLHPKPVQKPVQPPVQQVVKIDSASAPKKDSIAAAPAPDFLEKFRNNFKTFSTNFRNITDTLFTGVSVSLVPYISTNRYLSANTVNRYSFNILAGYSKGVDVLEIGGVVNVVDGNAKYFQMAGVGNVVSGNFTGFQISSVFNINHQRTSGMQVTGIYNETKRMDGFQLSSLVNKADTLNGCQLGGFLNEAEVVRGIQVSGFINKTKKLYGVQLGFLNISDTCSGAPIGFFSFVNKGYHKIGFETDELNFGTLSFGSGSYHFYNIFLAGMDLRQRGFWSYGYGIGSGYRFSRKWNLAFEATSRQIQPVDASRIYLSLLNRFQLGVEYSPFKRMRIGLGPSYNIMVADVNGTYFDPVRALSPSKVLYSQIRNDVLVKMWVGASFWVKFL